MAKYRLTWSPTGEYIGTVDAKSPAAARRKAPLPYRRALGEIAVEVGAGRPRVIEDIPVRTVYARALYRIDWHRNGNCFVSSLGNGSLTGAYISGAWKYDDALTEDIRALAMESKPV